MLTFLFGEGHSFRLYFLWGDTAAISVIVGMTELDFFLEGIINIGGAVRREAKSSAILPYFY